MKPNYPRLEALKIPIYPTPIYHVLCAELDAKLTEAGRKQFNDLFGIQTCPAVDGGSAVYPWDAEAVLERMASGRLTGSQLFWD